MANASSKKDFLQSLAAMARSFRARIESEVDGFSADAAARQLRRDKANGDLEVFARTYFPHYVTKPNSRLHDYLYRRLVAIADSPGSATDAIAAPRGEAKSTITSQIHVIWRLVTGRSRYAIIGMDAYAQAAVMLEAIKAELEANPRLAMDYPEHMGAGPVWQAGAIVTAGGAKLEAVGSGQRIRGRRHGPYRPDLFIGDDLENDENVRTPEQRDKLQAWLTKAVLKLGGAGEKFDVVIVGTVLHYDSVLARLLKNPLWKGERFKALIRWPDRMDLWEKWEGLLLSAGDAPAAAFYLTHQVEMDAGAEVSWPAGRPLVALMRLRARDGHASFDSELQNDPVSLDDAPFAALLAEGSAVWWHELPPAHELVMVGAVDPSLGKAGASRDPSALGVGAFHRKSGTLYVVKAEIRKRVPDRIISDVITLHRAHRCHVWVVEAVQFQEFLRTELVKRSAAAQTPVPARGVTPHADKLLRIEALQPHMANGLIRLHPSQTTLIEQLRHFPKADHDDGPDMLQMLWMAATTLGPGAAGFQAIPRHAGRGGRDEDDEGGGASRRML